MQTLLQIPGVSLEVYKEHRQLTPESDGYVGQLWSGSAAILAVIDPDAPLTISIFRDGCDHYIKQKDWLNNPATDSQQRCHDLYLADRTFADGTKVYGVKMPLRVDEEHSFNTVHYPENMLMLAQYHCGSDTRPHEPDYVLVWKVALVSQHGEFFLTVQKAYDVMICQSGGSKPRIPRLRGHRQLERLLLADAPENFRYCTTHDDPLPNDGDLSDLKLGTNEGVVERWYDARNMGCILTSHGPARVHWCDVPERSRRRFLVAGERVKFADLRQPPKNPETKWRKPRKSRFQLQAVGVKIIA